MVNHVFQVHPTALLPQDVYFSYPYSAEFDVVEKLYGRTYDIELRTVWIGKNTHPVGVKRLDLRITEEVFRRKTKPSKQVSKIWT